MNTLPWRKTKSSRISRFLSEFQQSPKRGRSLFVETGFPTSLVDLFFKNRDRLKKSSSKRLQRIQQQTQTAPTASSLINQDTILEKPSKKEVLRSEIKKDNFVGGGLKVEKKQAIENSGCVCVLMAFKVFIVAVLALSTKKKLTMGITISAFVLLLTEFMAARVFTRSKLCNTNNDKTAISREKIETLDKSISCLKETEHVVSVTEKSSLKDLTIRDLLLKDEKSKSKSSRLRSKIVKKMSSYKKKKTMRIKEESLPEVSSLVSEDKSEIIIDEKESNPPLTGSEGDKLNGIVLIVIVLTGLLSGKIVAIVLTLSCLVLRFGAAKKSDLCI